MTELVPMVSEKQPQSQSKVETFEHSSIGELKVPLEKIIREIHTSLETGLYAMIIGEDASGRIPTLALHQLISDINGKHARPKPELLFFAGTKAAEDYEISDKTNLIAGHISGTSNSKLEEIFSSSALEKRKIHQTTFLEKLRRNSKVLIVTDTIFSGDSLSPICEALKKLNIKYDIVTIRIMRQDVTNSAVKKKLSPQKLIFGSYDKASTYRRANLAGIKKNSTDVFSYSLKAGRSGDVVTARKDTTLLSKQLLEYYKTL